MPPSRISVSLIFFICGFIYTNWSTRLPSIQTLFSLNNSTLGLMLLCVAIGSLTSMPLAGWLIARRGSKYATTLSLLLFCCSLFLFPLLTVKWHLAVFFYIIGAFMGALDVAMNAQAVAIEQRYQAAMMSSFHAIFSVGMMLGALSGSFFVQFSITSHFTIVSAGSLLLAIGCLFFLIPDTVKPSNEGVAFRMPDRSMLFMGLIAFCAMLGEGAMADWSTNYLKNVLQTDASVAPLGLSAFSAAMTIGRFGGDKVRTIWGDKRLIFANSALAMLGLIIALIIPSVWVAIGGLFLVGLGMSTIIPIVYSTAGHNKSLPNGVGLAMVTTLGYFGFLFGPPVIGFLADSQGLRAALLFVVLLFGIMLFLSRKIEE
ncbi:MFS transporter [Runella sp.]|uniref:MFS transporter n=1 Tax=Runella sp. TaxID=1960881 RepID=UPI003D12779C